MSTIPTDARAWAKEIWAKIEPKMSVVMDRNAGTVPYTTKDGKYVDMVATGKSSWWTNGFWSGMLWTMFEKTGDKKYQKYALEVEKLMDKPLYDVHGLHHDVGFQWLLISVANYRLTANEDSARRGVIAANYLASRYNPRGGYLSAWNDVVPGVKREGWSIIDSMMNLPLLYWATEMTGYERYKSIAIAHADKTLENVVRDDGSVIHIIEYDVDTGAVIGTRGGQGYAVGSSWTRGQAWAIYGFTLSYIHTKDEKYLNAAKKIAHYFLAALGDDGIPPIDFRSPREPHYIDATAGAIAACGLIEIAQAVPQHEKHMYVTAAVKMLKALESGAANWSHDCDYILAHGSEAYDHGIDMSIIYGDYYFIEAITKLMGESMLYW